MRTSTILFCFISMFFTVESFCQDKPKGSEGKHTSTFSDKSANERDIQVEEVSDKPITLPVGYCADAAFIKKLNIWCANNQNDGNTVKDYWCVHPSKISSTEDFNDSFADRLKGNIRALKENAYLSCQSFCRKDAGRSALPVETIGFYMMDGEPEARTGQVDGFAYCHCPGTTTVTVTPPPSLTKYISELRAENKWEELADYDRQCSGRGNKTVKMHNNWLMNKKCFSRGDDRHMICKEGEIDYCTRFSGQSRGGLTPRHGCMVID